MNKEKKNTIVKKKLRIVPTSKKLKSNKRGFGDMEQKKKKKNGIRLEKGTTGYQILEVLKKYGTFEEDKLGLHITDKQPITISKMVRKLELNGYVMKVKVNGRTYIRLSRYSKKVFDVIQDKSTVPDKIQRSGNMAVAQLLFDQSNPQTDNEDLDKESYFELKSEIVKNNPGCGKILGTSRMIGVYHHYDEILPVFNLGNTLRWIDNVERQVKDYLEQQIFGVAITKAIYFVDNYVEEAMKYIESPPDATRIYGEAFRESLELATCYEKAFLFSIGNSGIAQLRLYRSHPYAEELFLQAVFEDDQRSKSPDSIIDGYINGENYVVLFSGDIIQIKRIRRILSTGMLDKLNIVCYTFQEPFLRMVFKDWYDRVEFRCFGIEELKGVFDF